VSQEDQTAAARLIDELARAWTIPLTSPTRDALLAYGNLLLDWGRRINLTGARSMRTLVSEHLPDSFALAKALLGEAESPETRVLDVGSGGGLPAIPLAILSPTTTLVLAEPTGKKVAFLRTAIRELGLGGRARVEARRVSAAPEASSPAFDVAISRATLPPGEWLELGWRLVVPGGRVFTLSSRRIDLWPSQLSLVGTEAYRPDRWLAEFRRSP
jgi:16S rRNA (guanine527-N7)-methyltransferase